MTTDVPAHKPDALGPDPEAVLDRLRDVRGVVFDMDGTLVLGDRRNHRLAPLPGALALTSWLTARGLPWTVFTNGTTRTPEAYAGALRSIGFALDDTAVLTPATSAVDRLVAEGQRRVVVLGGDGLKEPLRRAGIEVLEPKGKPQADAVLTGWYREFTMDDLEAACHAVTQGAALYSSSQSVHFASADGPVLGTSRILCAMIGSVTGVTEEVVGKPSRNALGCAAARLGIAFHDLAVVGDDPELEMAMARRGGALAVAVRTGIHTGDGLDTLPPEQAPHLAVEGLPELLALWRGACEGSIR